MAITSIASPSFPDRNLYFDFGGVNNIFGGVTDVFGVVDDVFGAIDVTFGVRIFKFVETVTFGFVKVLFCVATDASIVVTKAFCSVSNVFIGVVGVFLNFRCETLVCFKTAGNIHFKWTDDPATACIRISTGKKTKKKQVYLLLSFFCRRLICVLIKEYTKQPSEEIELKNLTLLLVKFNKFEA